MRLDFGSTTDPGQEPTKQLNEDSCGEAQSPFGHLFVVCDGMGGHHGGKQASTLAVHTVVEILHKSPAQTQPREALRVAIEEAGRRVYEFGGKKADQQRPGSTLVALLFHDGGTEVAHVGDSRAYSIRAGQLYRLTKDHSMVQEMVDAGEISAEQAANHPDANRITRALGMAQEVEVELRSEPMPVYEGDLYLLASDGLTDMMSDQEIFELSSSSVARKGPQAACDALVALANERGGYDNITVQLVRVLGVEPQAAATVAQEPKAGGQRPHHVAAGGHRPRTVVQGPTALSDPTGSTPEAENAPGVGGAGDGGPSAPLPGPADPSTGPATAGAFAPEPRAPEPTVLEEPALHDRVLDGEDEPTQIQTRLPAGFDDPAATTTPGAPAGRGIDATLDEGPPPGLMAPPDRSPPGAPAAMTPGYESDDDYESGGNTLIYIVLVMAAIIGILVVLLIWALAYR